MHYLVRFASRPTDLENAFSLRRHVFETEQNIPRPMFPDSFDSIADHAVAYANDGRCIGTGRAYRLDSRTFRIGRQVVAPDSREVTWGRSAPGFDQDVRFISAAFRKAVQNLNLDPDRVALGGRSDGAGYALSMGLAYGDTFNHVISIAGGMMAPVRKKGQPKIFIAHGTIWLCNGRCDTALLLA